MRIWIDPANLSVIHTNNILRADLSKFVAGWPKILEKNTLALDKKRHLTVRHATCA